MGKTARDLLKTVYLHVRQYGANYSISSSLFLVALQVALDELWSLTPGMWNRTHSKDKFTSLLTNEKNVLKIKTTHPIDRVNKLYYGPMIPLDGTLDLCDCPEDPMVMNKEHIHIPCCQCDFSIPSDPSYIELTQINAQNNLMNGQYQISGSDVAGMGGHYGQIVTVKLPPCKMQPQDCGLYITYWRGPQEITSFDDIVMVPRGYRHVLAMICAKYLLPISGIIRQNMESYFDLKIEQAINRLKEKDAVYATGFINKTL